MNTNLTLVRKSNLYYPNAEDDAKDYVKPSATKKERRIYLTQSAREDAKLGIIPVMVKRWIIHALREHGHRYGGPEYLKAWRLHAQQDGVLTSNVDKQRHKQYVLHRDSISSKALESLGIDLS